MRGQYLATSSTKFKIKFEVPESFLQRREN
jgi:hypothetical protein